MVQNDETQYIARILDGDTECFSAFLDRYSRPLYVLIVQIVGCSEDAEELVQDVFLKAFRLYHGRICHTQEKAGVPLYRREHDQQRAR